MDGSVSVSVGSAAVGQALETTIAQIAADTLGVPLGQVRLFHGSTPLRELQLAWSCPGARPMQCLSIDRSTGGPGR